MTAQESVDALATAMDADIVVYYGDLSRVYDTRILRQCRTRRRRKNVVLVLATFGGDVASAYRLARCFQGAYRTRSEQPHTRGTFSVFVIGVCKSAGTLLCLGADRIYMTEDSELGPIDVQLRKPEEVGERTSGLTPLQALETLQTHSLSHFKRHFRQLRFDDELAFSTKAAAEIATNLSVGLLREIYSQLDPIRLAEVERSLRVSSDYGERISSRNVKAGGLARLLAKYPTHGFIIDKIEAKEIFETVDDPTAEMEQYVQSTEYLDDYVYGDTPLATYASTEPAAVQPIDVAGGPHQSATPADGPARANPGGEQPEVQSPTRPDESAGPAQTSLVAVG